MDYLKNSFIAYCKKHKVAILFLVICLAVIFVTSFAQSAVQTDGWSVTVSDLRNATNKGVKEIQTTDKNTGEIVVENKSVDGKVVSGLLLSLNPRLRISLFPVSCSRTDISITAKCSFRTL